MCFRICKLLYFGVKPVFVFDGKAPLIKQRTLQERRERKLVHVEKKHVASQKLLQNYLKKQVLQTAIKNSGKYVSERLCCLTFYKNIIFKMITDIE